MWRSLTLAIRVAAVTAEGGHRLPVDLVPGPPIPRCSISLHCAAILNGGPMTSAERAECGRKVRQALLGTGLVNARP